MRNIGLIGLGATGLGLARSLRRAGYGMHVYDVRIDAARAFAAEGGVACASVAEMAAHCEVVVSAVVEGAQNQQILFGAAGAAGAMKPGSLFIVCSTVDPTLSKAWEGRLCALGILYLEAPASVLDAIARRV